MKPDETGLIEDLLKRRAQLREDGAAAGGPLCGDSERLAAYAEDSLDQESRETFQSHLAACTECREAVASLVRLTPRDALDNAAGAERPAAVPSAWWWKQWIWAPALAVLLVAASVVMMNRQRAAKQSNQVAQNQIAPLDAPSGQTLPAASPTAAPREAEKIAPPTKKHETARLKALAPIPAQPAETGPALAAKVTDAVGGGAGVAGSVASQEDKVAAAAPALRKQQDQQTAARASSEGRDQNQQASSPTPPPLTLAPAGAARQDSANQEQNRAASAPQAAPAPASRQRALETMAAAGAVSGGNRKAALIAPKGRIEKGALQLSTDGGATWQNVVTPEPVLSFQIADTLNFQIRGRSLTVFHTKDGGKTWQPDKAPQP